MRLLRFCFEFFLLLVIFLSTLSYLFPIFFRPTNESHFAAVLFWHAESSATANIFRHLYLYSAPSRCIQLEQKSNGNFCFHCFRLPCETLYYSHSAMQMLNSRMLNEKGIFIGLDADGSRLE